MILQSTMYQKQNIDLSSAPWTMHEYFAGSGLVAYGLRGMFAPVWANDISEQKAASTKPISGANGLFWTTSRTSRAPIYRLPIFRGPAFPAKTYLWQVLSAESMRPAAVWCGNGCECWMRWTINRRFSCWRTWRVCFRQTAATIIEFFIWRSWSEGINAELFC